jgi:glutathione S-transferase
MLLIGMFDSPFVRRVAISMKLLAIAFEHANWSVGRDFDRIRQYSALGRVPALVLDDGEVLSESAMILDYLDDSVGNERALLASTGEARRDALRLMALSIGAAEKGRDQIYESVFRPPARQYDVWVNRLQTQMHGALGELERYCRARTDRQWLVGDAMSQADITVTCAYTFLNEALPAAGIEQRYTRLAQVAARCEQLSAFQSTHVPFFTPAST